MLKTQQYYLIHILCVPTFFINFAKVFEIQTIIITALVAELVDALDLGSSVLRREGSSPFRRTIRILTA